MTVQSVVFRSSSTCPYVVCPHPSDEWHDNPAKQEGNRAGLSTTGNGDRQVTLSPSCRGPENLLPSGFEFEDARRLPTAANGDPEVSS